MKQNRTVLIWMVVSILLLAASQWFWIKSEYGEQRRTLFNNSDLVFKETVRTLEDSLYSRAFTAFYKANKEEEEKNKAATPAPSNPVRILTRQSKPQKKDTVQVTVKDTILVVEGQPLDSMSHLASVLNDSTVQQFLKQVQSNNAADSIANIKRIVTQLPRMSTPSPSNKEEDNNKSFRFSRRRFSPLSATRDSVNYQFNKKIKDLGYDLVFEITKDSIPIDTSKHQARAFYFNDFQKRLRTADDSIMVNGVMILNPEIISSYSSDPIVMYRAIPQNLNKFLLYKVKNNILFSIFLLLITLVTFALIYRNLLRQQRLNTLKNDLISNISHELKTPLSTLSVALEALQQFGLKAKPETTQEYLKISRNEVNRLSLMVDNILKTSLLEKHGVEISPEPLNLTEIAEEVIKSWKPRLENEGNNISLEVSGNDFNIEGDKVQIFSILNNLIDNAVKYAKDNVNIQLRLINHHNQVELEVEDNGIGIPKEYQKQVFDKFFRVPTGDRHNVKGYGLGLNFVKHIMDLHHGSVNLKSNEHGTTFTLAFQRKL